MRHLRHLTLAAAAVAALALAGCGGSGSSTTATEQSPADTPADTPADNPTQLAALESAHAQAKAALATLQDNLGDATQAEVDAVKAKLAELERVLAAAAGVSDQTKKMYAAEPLETELAAAEQAAALAIAAGNEKQAAIAAAKKALDAAEVAKDLAADGRDATEADGDTPAMAAKTGSAKAQEALMGLVLVQTGGGKAKMHADKAVEAAGKAQNAYEAAKKAYETARAAATVEAAVRARQNAEDARRDAEMYAKTANDEAMKAVQAAAMELGRSGDDRMTWSIGSGGDKKSITVTTGGGTNATVGTPEKSAVTASGTSATGPDVTLANLDKDRPLIFGRDIVLGKQHDHAETDNTARLRLMDKYYSDMLEVGIYVAELVTEGTQKLTISGTADNPGTVTHADDALDPALRGKKFPLTKVTGRNYWRTSQGTGLTKGTAGGNWDGQGDDAIKPNQYFRQVHTLWVEETEKKVGDAGDLYSYTGDDNKERFVMILSNGSPRNAYVIKGKYGLPVIYEHMHVNYGMWNTMKDEKPADLGIGFVTVLEGKDKTPLANTLRVGTATYQGGWVGTVRSAASSETGLTNRSGASEVTADFTKNTVEVSLTGLAMLEGAIDGNGFMGTEVTDVEDIGDLTAAADGAGYTGEFSGAFYGPRAEEVGGVFDFDGEKKGAFRGAFGGGVLLQ